MATGDDDDIRNLSGDWSAEEKNDAPDGNEDGDVLGEGLFNFDDFPHNESFDGVEEGATQAAPSADVATGVAPSSTPQGESFSTSVEPEVQNEVWALGSIQVENDSRSEDQCVEMMDNIPPSRERNESHLPRFDFERNIEDPTLSESQRGIDDSSIPDFDWLQDFEDNLESFLDPTTLRNTSSRTDLERTDALAGPIANNDDESFPPTINRVQVTIDILRQYMFNSDLFTEIHLEQLAQYLVTTSIAESVNIEDRKRDFFVCLYNGLNSLYVGDLKPKFMKPLLEWLEQRLGLEPICDKNKIDEQKGKSREERGHYKCGICRMPKGIYKDGIRIGPHQCQAKVQSVDKEVMANGDDIDRILVTPGEYAVKDPTVDNKDSAEDGDRKPAARELSERSRKGVRKSTGASRGLVWAREMGYCMPISQSKPKRKKLDQAEDSKEEEKAEASAEREALQPQRQVCHIMWP